MPPIWSRCCASDGYRKRGLLRRRRGGCASCAPVGIDIAQVMFMSDRPRQLEPESAILAVIRAPTPPPNAATAVRRKVVLPSTAVHQLVYTGSCCRGLDEERVIPATPCTP